MRFKLLSLAIALVALSSGCGGGGGNDEPTTSRPVGLWNGSTSSGRSATALTLIDGRYFLLYSAIGNPTAVGGFVYGHSSSSNLAFTSNDARDFNLEGLGVSIGELGGRYAAGASIQAVVSFSSGTVLGFEGAYDSSNGRQPSLDEVAGTYVGQVLLPSGAQSATVAVAADGSVHGNANACLIAGNVSPRTDSFAYDFVMTFGPAPCYFANMSFTGIAVLNPATRRLLAASPNASGSDGVVFSGLK